MSKTCHISKNTILGLSKEPLYARVYIIIMLCIYHRINQNNSSVSVNREQEFGLSKLIYHVTHITMSTSYSCTTFVISHAENMCQTIL